jgi:hypothetical protein
MNMKALFAAAALLTAGTTVMAAEKVAPVQIYSGITYDGATLRVDRPGKNVKLPFSFQCRQDTPISLGDWSYPDFDAYLNDSSEFTTARAAATLTMATLCEAPVEVVAGLQDAYRNMIEIDRQEASARIRQGIGAIGMGMQGYANGYNSAVAAQNAGRVQTTCTTYGNTTTCR